jgi:hypothetical protein
MKLGNATGSAGYKFNKNFICLFKITHINLLKISKNNSKTVVKFSYNINNIFYYQINRSFSR